MMSIASAKASAEASASAKTSAKTSVKTTKTKKKNTPCHKTGQDVHYKVHDANGRCKIIISDSSRKPKDKNGKPSHVEVYIGVAKPRKQRKASVKQEKEPYGDN